MAADGIEHHTEVRRQRWSAPVVLAVGALVVAAAFAFLRADGGPATDAVDANPTTASSALASTPPTRLAVLHVVADTDGGPRPATTADGPGAEGGPAFEAIQATPVLTDGQVVVLADGGTVLAGRPGAAFRVIGPDAPSAAIVASNEPGHVWALLPDGDLVLVAVDGVDPPVRIPLGGARVLGPASFGVVTIDTDGVVAWRRPSFEPTVVPVPPGRSAIDAGGGFVLVERPPGGDGERVFEVLTVADGALVGGFRGGSDRPAALANDGATVAVPDGGGWTIREVRSVAARGALPAAPGEPVWIGGDRWAVLLDGVVRVSDGTELSPPWRFRALAEQSP